MECCIIITIIVITAIVIRKDIFVRKSFYHVLSPILTEFECKIMKMLPIQIIITIIIVISIVIIIITIIIIIIIIITVV